MAVPRELSADADAAGSLDRPVLSLVLCSRNDQYMGNSRWRLQTALNYVARRTQGIDSLRGVEILVAGWGSDLPVSDSVALGPAASSARKGRLSGRRSSQAPSAFCWSRRLYGTSPGGYDEDMINIGAMETNMMGGHMRKHPIVDLGPRVGHDFYHLERHHPWAVRSWWAHRRPNDGLAKMDSALEQMSPNGQAWVLAGHSLGLKSPAQVDPVVTRGGSSRTMAWLVLIGNRSFALVELLLVRVSRWPSLLRSAARMWAHRVDVVRAIVRGRPVFEWAGLLPRCLQHP